MSYIDGFVVAVPTKNKQVYKELALDMAQVFKDHGALGLVECWGDDVPEGEVTSFPMAVQCRPDETVVFSWITWPSREVRNSGMQAAMGDERMKKGEIPMPFDVKRMIYGGFETLVEQ